MLVPRPRPRPRRRIGRPRPTFPGPRNPIPPHRLSGPWTHNHTEDPAAAYGRDPTGRRAGRTDTVTAALALVAAARTTALRHRDAEEPGDMLLVDLDGGRGGPLPDEAV
ncbi:hypothetical protein AB0D92_35090 [Streptomyces parvus]|uniref:hypothetical protein n=1 Tax=Streptomyces parvus TaxID=66428 RepID=UPI0033DBC347